MIFDKHANLKYKFGNRHFWAEGYYVSTVELNEATITVICMVFNGVTLIICLILAFVALIGFMLIAIEIDLAYLEFYLVALFGFTMFCFCGEEHLRRQGTHSINAVFTSGVKLFFYCVFTVILNWGPWWKEAL